MARIGPEVALFIVMVVVPSFSWARSKPQSPPQQEPARIAEVKILLEKDSPVLQITSTRPVIPTITKSHAPQRLVIDLWNSRMSARRKRINLHSEGISVVRLQQYLVAPPVVRITVDLRKPHSYTWNTVGNRLMIRLHAEGQEVLAKPPSVPARTQGVQPVAVPVSAANSGNVLLADRFASGLSLAAAANTTVLRLTRGGEIHVCSGTTVSLIHSHNGPDLMLSMNTGTLETHYELENSADSILTPDFRILLRGPGEFHFGISADSRGNICVRTLPGDTGSAIISELIGDGTYKVEPGELLVLGRLSGADPTVPGGCGCRAPTAPVMRASLPAMPVISESSLPGSVRLAQPGDEAKPVTAQSDNRTAPSQVKLSMTDSVPAPLPNQVHVQVDASLVFPPPAQPVAPASISEAKDLPLGDSVREALLPAEVLPPAPAQAQIHKPRRGVFRGIKGIFARIFR